LAEPYVKRRLAQLHAEYAYFLYNHLYPEKALEHIRAAQDLAGDFPQLHFVLGRLAEQETKYADAAWEYEQTLSGEPGHRRAAKSLARLKRKYPRLIAAAQPESYKQRKHERRVRKSSPRLLPKRQSRPPESIQEAISHFAGLTGFDPGFIETIIRIESDFDPGAVSEANCRGLMQLGRAAWEDMTKRLGRNWSFEKHVHDPVKNIEIGCEYFRWMRDVFFPRYMDVLPGVPLELLLIQGYHSGPWRTVVYRGDVPGPRMQRYKSRFASLRTPD
jgi:soluble lytic murein transglycosylase-like protein